MMEEDGTPSQHPEDDQDDEDEDDDLGEEEEEEDEDEDDEDMLEEEEDEEEMMMDENSSSNLPLHKNSQENNGVELNNKEKMTVGKGESTSSSSYINEPIVQISEPKQEPDEPPMSPSCDDPANDPYNYDHHSHDDHLKSPPHSRSNSRSNNTGGRNPHILSYNNAITTTGVIDTGGTTYNHLTNDIHASTAEHRHMKVENADEEKANAVVTSNGNSSSYGSMNLTEQVKTEREEFMDDNEQIVSNNNNNINTDNVSGNESNNMMDMSGPGPQVPKENGIAISYTDEAQCSSNPKHVETESKALPMESSYAS